jgi:hypothetical protein
MKKLGVLIVTIASLINATDCFGQDSTWQRTYDFTAYNNYDLRNSSRNFISAFRAINDGYTSVVDANMKPKGAAITKGALNFATIYLTMLWSHEMGHYIRAEQVGGHFNIHNFGLPVPYTTADLPEDISLVDEAIFVTAGFEVNYLNVRTLQAQFVGQNGLWNPDLALSFANRLMYPIYTTFIVPINPEDKNVWIETAGDPVHYILPVFKNYANNQVFLEDSTVVNPELVNLYNQATIFGSFFMLLDPQFYREVGAAFGKASKTRRPIFLIGDFNTGWTYGTLFNASPLGYELYLQNYIHINNNQFGLYLKYGRPFKNIGLGLSMNNVLNFPNFSADVLAEVWQQDIFGNGASLEFSGKWKLSKHFGFNFNLGYKSEGYVLGKQLNAGANLGIGLSIFR